MFYENYKIRYKNANQEIRQASKVHWIKCHKENIESGRKEMIIFSAQILAIIAIIENEE